MTTDRSEVAAIEPTSEAPTLAELAPATQAELAEVLAELDVLRRSIAFSDRKAGEEREKLAAAGRGSSVDQHPLNTPVRNPGGNTVHTEPSEVAAIEQPDQHREAYALMRYESAETPTPSVSRVVWNSRDGVTPFGFTDPETGIGLTHVRWHEDVRKPDHVPHPDQLVFITEWPTIEEFTARARRMIERSPEYAPPEGPDRDALVDQLAHGMMRDCGEHGQPAIVTGQKYLDLGVL